LTVAPGGTPHAQRSRVRLVAQEKAELWERLERDARRIARAFSLTYRTIEPEREGVRRHYGITYSDGTIRIRLRHAKTGRPLKYSSLINTVCHELAHLKHFNHGPRFKKYYFKILEWARSEGLYRPTTSEPLKPFQMGLFAACEPKVTARGPARRQSPRT
jgi:predicted metal-dependent hydrolase